MNSSKLIFLIDFLSLVGGLLDDNWSIETFDRLFYILNSNLTIGVDWLIDWFCILLIDFLLDWLMGDKDGQLFAILFDNWTVDISVVWLLWYLSYH